MNALTRLTLLAAEGGGGVETVLPAPAELFWGAVAFGVFYLIMSKVAFPKINEVLEERAASIQGRQEEAQEQLDEAQRVRRRYEEQLKDAKGEANRIIEEAKQTAESLRRDIVAKAESEAESIVQRAQSEVQAERERAVQQLRQEVGRLSVQLAEKIVGKELDQSAHQSLVDRYISQLSGNGNGHAPSGTPTERSEGGVATQTRPDTGDTGGSGGSDPSGGGYGGGTSPGGTGGYGGGQSGGGAQPGAGGGQHDGGQPGGGSSA